MQLLFENGVQVPIELTNSPVQDTILRIYKHLQHVPIPFKEWDSPLYKKTHTFDEIFQNLKQYADRLGIIIDNENCNQDYWNYLHKIYEQNYNGDPDWLAFHEHVHICEDYYTKGFSNILIVDYREKSGLLECPFDQSWMSSSTTMVRKGDVYLSWAELSKPPYDYWKDGEPNQLTRLCELSKPWKILRPRLVVALADIDRLADKDQIGFNSWWEQYEQSWCNYYKMPHWTLEQQESVLVIGHIDDVEQINNLLTDQIYPIKVQL